MSQSNIAIVAGILSSFATLVALIILLLLSRKYLQRKTKNTLYLTLSVFSWILAFVFATNIYFLSEINLEWVIWCQKLVYIGVFLGIMFSFQFSQGIFINLKKNFITLYWIVGSIIILLTLILDSVEISTFLDGSDYPLLTISLLFSILVVVFIIPTVFSIIYFALQLAKKTQVREYKVGFRIIVAGQFMIFATFIADTLASVFAAQITLYAILLYLTWIFPIIAVVCYYLGWIMPSWFVKWLKIEKNAE
jgi:hypothetical protein